MGQLTNQEAQGITLEALRNGAQIGSAAIGAQGTTDAAKIKANAALKELLLGKQKDQENEAAKIKATHDADNASEDTRRQRVQQDFDQYGQMHPGKKVSINASKDGYSMSEAETNPAIQLNNRISQETARVSHEAKNTLGPFKSSYDNIEAMHNLLDNPNSVDQKQLGAMEARLTEGNGQRLLQSLVESLGGNTLDLQSKGVSGLNYILGAAKSGLSQEKVNAYRDNLFKHQQLLDQQYGDAKNQFNAMAPGLGPTLNANGMLENMVGKQLAPIDNVSGRLGKRLAAFQAQSQAAGAGPAPSTQPAPQYQNQGVVDKLKAYFGGGQGAVSSPKAPATTGGLSPEQEARRQALLQKAQGL